MVFTFHTSLALGRRFRTVVLACVLACSGSLATAHDSWFEPLQFGPRGHLLALGTGNLFPAFEQGVDARYLVSQGCRDDQAAPSALQALRNLSTTLLLRAASGASTCWMQLTPFDLELSNDKVDLYLDEVNATPALRTAWRLQREAGLPWRERYTKHARVALRGTDDTLGAAAALPAPIGMDMLLEQRGEMLHAQALRNGQALAGFAVELRGTQPGGAVRWMRTDTDGRVAFARPPAGRWLLRGIDLRPSSERPGTWESDFITLAFELGR